MATYTRSLPSIHLSQVGDSVDLLVTATSPSSADITPEGGQGYASFFATNSVFLLPPLFSVAGLPPGWCWTPRTPLTSNHTSCWGDVPVGAVGNSPSHVTVTVTDGRWSKELAFDWFVAVPGVNTVSLPKPGGGGLIDVSSPVGASLGAAITQDAGVALPNGIVFPFGFLELACERPLWNDRNGHHRWPGHQCDHRLLQVRRDARRSCRSSFV